jgi:cytochrome b
MTNRILVWDPPKRAFHWLLAAAFVGTIGGESKREKAAKNKHGGEHGTHHH